MTYQKKSYKKFVATAATATLVASAIVPAVSASFTDVEETHEFATYINAAVDAGYIKGYADGTFGINDNLKRSQVVIIIGRYLEKLGYSSDATTSPWSDVKDEEVIKYGNIVKEAGVFTGYTDGTLNGGGFITRENMAVVLDRLAKTVTEGTSLSDVAKDIEDVKVADLATANAAYQESIQALRDLGISTAENFNPKGNLKRGQFAKFIMNAVEKIEAIAPATEELALESVTAINAKTIEVKFNTAVEDTSKATVELLRGTFKQNVTLKWAEDKKSVELIGVGNFQAGEYTVNVSGLSTEKLTGTIKIEAQKIASIEILDDIAVVSASKAGAVETGATATVGYLVKDQYGSDITKTASLTTNSKNIKAVNGVVTLEADEIAGKKIGDLVPVVLVDTTTGISVTKTVKLSAESTVSSIEVAGVYNAKGESVELNDKSKASEAFIVLNLKDQYGKEITEVTKASGLVITNTNPANLTIDETVTTQKIGDKDKLVIAIKSILKAGDTDVLLISTTNGQSAKYTVKVAETSTTDSISVSQPEMAVAGEDTLIPLTVTDKAGNVITDKKLLADSNKGIKVGQATVKESELEVKDGQVYYKKKLSAGTQALVFQTSTYKVATVTINVKEEAKPTVVRGLKNPLVISKAQGSVEITAKDHLVIEDQYGRVMKDSNAPVKVTVVGESDVVSLEGNTVKADKKGTATLKVELVTPNGKIDSAVEVKVQVTDGTEYSDYEIAEIGKVQAGTAKKIKVNGLLNDGKVALEADEYTATISGGTLTSEAEVTNGEFTIAEDKLNVDSSKKPVDTEFTLKVTIEATGKVLEQKFVVSPEKATVQDFFFTTTEVAGDYASAKAITEATLATGGTVADLTAGETNAVVNVATVDQYGNKAVVEIDASTITVVPAKVGEVAIQGNGTSNPTITLANGVDKSTVTLKVTIGKAVKEITVNVVTP